ncbi:MAG TPA: NUDIX hydrolase [Candidatus Paceibacterota bacterium]|nr:NUDIX hydrolase [Candidatus Paceibacterota bacterium]HPT40537.1 NUDIX hydrolase [Candidatus Paceibacterota bacterium]
MTPVIFTKKVDEFTFEFKLLSGGFVGVILVTPNGKIVCQKETNKDYFRFPGGGIDQEDGDLFEANSQEDFLGIARKTAVREVKEECGLSIDISRLRFLGFSMTEDEKDREGGKSYMRTFFSYKFLPEEKILGNQWSSEENGERIEYQFRQIPVEKKRANLEGIRLSSLHFAALIAFLRAPQ